MKHFGQSEAYLAKKSPKTRDESPPEYRGKGAYRAMYVDKTNYRAQQVYKKLGMDECHYLMYEEVLG